MYMALLHHDGSMGKLLPCPFMKEHGGAQQGLAWPIITSSSLTLILRAGLASSTFIWPWQRGQRVWWIRRRQRETRRATLSRSWLDPQTGVPAMYPPSSAVQDARQASDICCTAHGIGAYQWLLSQVGFVGAMTLPNLALSTEFQDKVTARISYFLPSTVAAIQSTGYTSTLRTAAVPNLPVRLSIVCLRVHGAPLGGRISRAFPAQLWPRGAHVYITDA
jgi:hypothetical protein